MHIVFIERPQHAICNLFIAHLQVLTLTIDDFLRRIVESYQPLNLEQTKLIRQHERRSRSLLVKIARRCIFQDDVELYERDSKYNFNNSKHFFIQNIVESCGENFPLTSIDQNLRRSA